LLVSSIREATMVLLLTLLLQLRIQVGVPTIRFEVAPQLVEVQPGLLVVNDYDEEVFFVDGAYWVRWRDGRWYRARSHRGGWVAAAPAMVPAVLVRVPPGQYKRHKGKPEKFRVLNADGSVTEFKTKEKHGVTEVKVKEKRGKGRWK
jgi:hypothetical protein